MNVFGKYARYYNLLYRDKDYAKEALFIHKLLQQYAPGKRSILELGCGTGTHAKFLAEKGYHIHGIDMSEEMFQQAEKQRSQYSQDLASRIVFSHGDIRNIRLDRQSDAIISLFHVVSYQTTNEDLQATFTTAKVHLKQGGVFIFDCWYGPAVLSERPTVRIKRLEDEMIQVTRIAEPVMHLNKNVVDVNYHVFIRDKRTNAVEEIRETHKMRYLFAPEIRLFISNLGFKIIDFREWMTDCTPGCDTWGVYFVLEA